MADIRLANGQMAIIDDEWAERLAVHAWRVDGCGYAVCAVNSRPVLMHRIIAGAKAGELVDHRNGNPIDNRSENLRLCSHAENMRNRKVSKSNKLGVKGVRFIRERNRYRAEIKIDGRRISLGSYLTAEAAQLAYINAAKLHHGEFANSG